MCAMIPMFRVRSRVFRRLAMDGPQGGVASRGPPGRGRTPGARVLEAVVGEGLVRLRHLLQVFTALDRRADAVGCVEQLVGETLGHRLLTTLAGVADDPADRERV